MVGYFYGGSCEKNDHPGETMKIKEIILEFLKVIGKVKTGQPTDRKEIERRIKDLENLTIISEKKGKGQ